jgi:hypothetical protein
MIPDIGLGFGTVGDISKAIIKECGSALGSIADNLRHLVNTGFNISDDIRKHREVNVLRKATRCLRLAYFMAPGQFFSILPGIPVQLAQVH